MFDVANLLPILKHICLEILCLLVFQKATYQCENLLSSKNQSSLYPKIRFYYFPFHQIFRRIFSDSSSRRYSFYTSLTLSNALFSRVMIFSKVLIYIEKDLIKRNISSLQGLFFFSIFCPFSFQKNTSG